ncbi:MAG: energy-converting hydrogenase subunit [Methanobacterium sp.]|jgi:energy-converting hydrogenase B subunit B|uniref:monovalent cation/H+ antiporter complex subunit F n=1 Tax=Methanobacterium sp. TaxID=2164 RepID=UPI0003C9481C|nr:monovalent cation/H+ antiporter complex subunit F [Methanobacterium sp.]MDI3549928.1 energy-converting hydrogenase subunit [Methanobacterium sp.]CDG65894.1 putative membrane protein [Methanobacterium sp. MB1]
MDILTLSEYILMAALAIYALASLRIAARKNIGMGLVGVSGLSISVATILVIVQNIYGIAFCKDIATALVLLGPVGTIAFARVLRGYNHG